MLKSFFLLVTIVFATKPGFAQQLIDENTYVARNGMTFKVNDDIVLGYGSNFNKDFKYITTGLNSMAGPMSGIGAPWHGKKFTIKRIREMGSDKKGKTYYLVIGAGLMNFWVDADAAMEYDEIIYPDEFKSKKSIQQAAPASVADELIKLKKLLDEGALTKEEFETQKKKLLEKNSN